MLTPDETIEMIDAMVEQADLEMENGVYWDGWADGLRTLRSHILTSVKVTCFPAGRCHCHPFQVGEKTVNVPVAPG